MNRDEAIKFIKEQKPDFLEPDRVGGYICPVCGSGSGANGTGLTFSREFLNYTCWPENKRYDVISLWQKKTGEDFNTALKSLCDYYGITIDHSPTDYSKNYQHKKEPKKSEPVKDYTKHIIQCAQRIDELKPEQLRGISKETAIRYCIGYNDKEYFEAMKEDRPALIIPVSKNHYIARNLLPDPDHNHRWQKRGKDFPIFNQKALERATQPIFITEGQLDALSIIEAGGEAIALGSNANQFLNEFCKEKKPAQPLIIALDNDEKGNEGADKLETQLKELKIEYYRHKLPESLGKDQNEALLKDPDQFRAWIEKGKSLPALAREQIKAEYNKLSTGSKLQGFMNRIQESQNLQAVSTGFPILDNTLEGGLYPGLYSIGAISSLGKTTLILQIGDQIAKAGEDVLIFSLEMAEDELMAKSISRNTILECIENGIEKARAKTTRGILTGSRYKNYPQKDIEVIQKAINRYSEYAGNIFIQEGSGDLGVKHIRERIREHIERRGKNPVVIVDYLQIMSPADIKATDKQNIDKAVLELKRISRDNGIPVIAISSLNRENYEGKISMKAFKESGAIEYSSDVLIGLQLKGAGEKDFDSNEAKRKETREIELVILKNRNGATGKKINFSYYPMFNYFKEVENQKSN